MAPKRRKRPRDFSQAAKMVIDVATGQVKDQTPPTPDRAAVALGQKGGAARAKSMTAQRRTEIARRAAQKRWAKD